MSTIASKPLFILNASAGSGKTYSLVRNYLRLLLQNGEERAELGEIIAMTFTNKAALEMKTRILSDLNKLANGGSESDRYCNEMADFIGLKPLELRKNAKHVLKKLMHQFENFNVMTIDKFNLKLIRSFSRDLNLPDQFQVVIDENLVLEKAIDELLNTIDKNNINNIYQLAINYAKSNLDEENKWNVKSALLESAQILKEERSFEVIRNLTQKTFDEADLNLWRIELKQIIQTLDGKQRDLKVALDKSGLTQEDFHRKGQTFGRVVKILSATGGIKDRFDAYSMAASQPESIEKTRIAQNDALFCPKLLNFHDYWQENKASFYEKELKVSQFYILAILRELAISMESIREKESIIRISEFNQLVADLVRNEDAPFIYERLGNRFSHFFLDEFQDTSRLQWLNLIPLVHNSIAQNKFNFIVGDPKQSIYRFKNGIAEQFVVLPEIYNPEHDAKTAQKSAYFKEMGEKKGLDSNWRSAKEIVQFNNELFTALVLNIHDRGKTHYNPVIQDAKGKEDGLVVIEIPNSNFEKYETPELNALEKWVRECIADGYSPGDICVLSRKKKECNAYANHLKSKGFSVVSSDSLMVNSDEYVQLMIALLKWRNNPLEKQYGMHFSEIYFRLTNQKDSYKHYSSCFERVLRNEKESSQFSSSLFFEISGIDAEILNFGYSTLYDLLQQCMRYLFLDVLKNPYLHQLLDIAFRFDNSNGPDLLRFIQYYDDVEQRSNVQLPENQDSIKIMTAHKSKGLEFPVVIIPSLTFESGRTNHNSQLLQKDDQIIETSLTTADSVIPEIKAILEVEKEDVFMDDLNLMYVTFTRPVDRMYAFHSGKLTDKSLVGMLAQFIANRYPESSTKTGISLRLGKSPKINQDTRSTNYSFVAKSEKEMLWFPDISLQSTQEEKEASLSHQQRIGNHYHKVMEASTDEASALLTLKNLVIKGSIEEVLTKDLTDLIHITFKHKDLVQILAAGIHLDERTLLLDERIKLRPDKIIRTADKTIVLDFKTGEEKAEHLKQVSDYAFALRIIGYSNIEGYLFYAGGCGLKQVKFDVFE